MVIPLFPLSGQNLYRNYKTLQNFSKISEIKIIKDK